MNYLEVLRSYKGKKREAGDDQKLRITCIKALIVSSGHQGKDTEAFLDFTLEYLAGKA